MKHKIKRIVLYFGLLLLGTIWMTGCGGDGGGSGDDSPPDPAPTPTVASVQLGTPICSVDGAGSVNGPSFSGNQGQVTVDMDGDNPSAYMRVWLQVNVTGAAISHYDWEIVGWQNQIPHGGIAYEDEVIDIDINQGIYKVRSYGNKVRYDSTSNSALTNNFTQQIKVTAWTSEGKFTTAYFTLFLVPAGGGSGDDHGDTAATATIVTVNGKAASGEINPAADKDMFKFTAIQGTSYSIETGGSLDTVIVLYDRDGVSVLDSDDDGGTGTSSLIDWTCLVSGTYYVGVFSYNSQYAGSYTLTISGTAPPPSVDVTGNWVMLADIYDGSDPDHYLYLQFYTDGSIALRDWEGLVEIWGTYSVSGSNVQFHFGVQPQNDYDVYFNGTASGNTMTGTLTDTQGLNSGATATRQVGSTSVSIASGGETHSLFLRNDGTVLGTGKNNYGQLGDGTTISRTTPSPVMIDVAAVAASDYHSLFLKNDATVWAVGLNRYGQLGDGTTIQKTTPFQVMSGVAAVAADGDHSFFLKTDGSLWATGNNRNGKLGDGSKTDRSTPVKVVDSDVVAVAPGVNQTLLIKNNSTAWGAGYNAYGQLGIGSSADVQTFVPVMLDVAAVASGFSNCLFVKNDGTAWGAGRNTSGQLGDGTTSIRSTPVQVMDNVVDVAMGWSHSLFLKADGSVWATGSNAYGQLGDGTTENKLIPVKVMDNVSAISAGNSYSLFSKTDGSVWVAGRNDFGQLGNGSTADILTPIKVIDP